MIPSLERDRALCPACSNPWQDRGGIIRKALCSECGQVLLLTEQHRGKTILCPRCHSLLGCLVSDEATRSGRRSTIFDIMALTLAVAAGYTVALRMWAEQVPQPILHGISVVVLSITWTLVVLRLLSAPPARRRLFYPPGLAACVAVLAASVLNFYHDWDRAYATFPSSQSLLSIAALRAVQPLPLAAAVAGTWLVLALDRRWRPEPSWIDRTGRCLGVYWLALGLIMPLVRLSFA
jgi:phage FluMu protein Com